MFDFLLAHGGDLGEDGDLVYADASDFVSEADRNCSRTWGPVDALNRLTEELAALGIEIDSGAQNVKGSALIRRQALAVRVPGANAIRCSECEGRFGGTTSFDRHRPTKGPDKNRCRSGAELGLTYRNGAWRSPAPAMKAA